MRGIDVSNHQGTVDWPAVGASTVEFAFLKATEGVSFRDAFYKANRAGAKRAGLAVGAYHFGRPGGADGRREADFFLEVAQPKPGELRPVLDLEASDGVSPAAVRAWALTFLRRVTAELGVTPFLYTYPFFATGNAFASSPELAGFPLWIAHYGVTKPLIPKPWKSAVIWQFSSSGRVPGVKGRCDLNKLLRPCDPLGCYRL